jgi:hypothetical protein
MRGICGSVELCLLVDAMKNGGTVVH